MKRILLLLAALLPAPPAALSAADKPNVLLIMADDLRDYGGAFTHDVVKTPNLDRLRARGTTFERAYVQYPVCNPSRSSMLTGLRAEQTGIVTHERRCFYARLTGTQTLRSEPAHQPLAVDPLERWTDRTVRSRSRPRELYNVADQHAGVLRELTIQLQTIPQPGP